MITKHIATVIIQTNFCLAFQQHIIYKKNDELLDNWNYHNDCKNEKKEDEDHINTLFSFLLFDMNNAIKLFDIIYHDVPDLLLSERFPFQPIDCQQTPYEQKKIVAATNKMEADIIGLMEVENNGPGITLKEWIRLAHKKNNQTSKTSGNVTADNTMSKFDFVNAVILAKEITKTFGKIHNLGV
eukprot:6582963-Ditylum_brightwellii.AAC.1